MFKTTLVLLFGATFVVGQVSITLPPPIYIPQNPSNGGNGSGGSGGTIYGFNSHLSGNGVANGGDANNTNSTGGDASAFGGSIANLLLGLGM